MQVLVIGAGAVGRVIGAHLRRGGARVTYLVKPEHAHAVRAGFSLYRHRTWWRGVREHREPGFEALSAMEALSSRGWNAVVLGLGSPALRDAAWLSDLGRATGEAPVLTLAPGLEDPEILAEHLGSGRVVPGMFGLLAYAAPLGDQVLPPGTAFWVPPGAGVRFAAESARPVVDALRRGGLPAAIDSDARAKVAFAGALLDPLVAALECTGWRLGELPAQRELLGLARAAAREAGAVVAHRLGRSAPRSGASLLRPAAAGLAVGAATRLAPLDLEAYLRAHYTKVGDQTRLGLRTYRALGKRASVPTGAIAELLVRLEADSLRGAQGGSTAILRGPAATASRRRRGAKDPAVISGRRASQLRTQSPRALDPSRSVAIKRNVHSFEVAADAASFARAFEEVLAEPTGTIGTFQLRREVGRRGRPFAVGERFQGCFSPRLALRERDRGRGIRIAASLAGAPLVRWVEDALLSDYAQVVKRRDDSAAGLGVSYAYLPGTPFRGRSRLSVTPAGDRRCRLTATFEFQEDGVLAVAGLHLFGLRAHDRLLIEQVHRAARRLSVPVTQTTVR